MMNEDLLWNAVLARDPQWDGVFVYAVTSTGIFCRPTCPSRRPRRANVTFFAGATAAANAGFRPCRRCAPESAAEALPHLDRVRRVCTAIARAPHERLTLSTLARHAGGSRHHLLRTFKKTLGISPREYADACREGCLRERLRGGGSVTTATYDAGYGSGSRVYERSDRGLGMTPRTYASGGLGADVYYATAPCAFGRVLVAATARGICSVKIGDEDEQLRAAMRAEYPRATLAPLAAPLKRWIQQIVRSLEPGAPDPRLPLDIKATAFQRLVWRQLQGIPRGQTRSYRAVASAMGHPAAARAVARACAANPVAILIPCHRVVRHDGSPGGYRWGPPRKEALLAIERAAARRAG